MNSQNIDEIKLFLKTVESVIVPGQYIKSLHLLDIHPEENYCYNYQNSNSDIVKDYQKADYFAVTIDYDYLAKQSATLNELYDDLGQQLSMSFNLVAVSLKMKNSEDWQKYYLPWSDSLITYLQNKWQQISFDKRISIFERRPELLKWRTKESIRQTKQHEKADPFMNHYMLTILVAKDRRIRRQNESKQSCFRQNRNCI